MMYALSFVLATTVAASSPTPSAGSGDAVVRIGPRSGKLQFQAFSRLTDPFGQFGSWRGEVKIPGGDLSRAEVMVRVELSTVDTQNAKRDAHLQNCGLLQRPEVAGRGVYSQRAQATWRRSLSGQRSAQDDG